MSWFSTLDEVEGAELGFQLVDGGPGEDEGVLPFVWWVGGERIRPDAAAYEGEEGALVKPGEADFGDGAGPASDNDTGVAGEGH